MNIRVLLFTAGIAAVQVLSAIELTADSNRLEAGEAFVKMLVEYQEPGRAGTKCRWDFRGMQILSEELPVEYFIPDSSHMDILCGREGRNRYYYRQGSDSLWCVGHENATFYIDYARPELLLRYPFAYGDSLTSRFEGAGRYGQRIPLFLSLIHISEPTRQAEISYAVFCLKKKKIKSKKNKRKQKPTIHQ